MTANISTDQELDRILSMREASNIPLPPEIALSEPRDSKRYFDWLFPYRFLGLESHPIVQMLKCIERERMMAASISRADYLDRISHYGSFLNGPKLHIVDLTAPTKDDRRGCPGGPSVPIGTRTTYLSQSPSPDGRGSGRRRPKGASPPGRATQTGPGPRCATAQGAGPPSQRRLPSPLPLRGTNNRQQST